MKIISKYQTCPLYNICKAKEALGKIKEINPPSSVKNSWKNSESTLFKKAHAILLCLRAKVLTQESRNIYFIRYIFFFFFEDPL